METIADETRTDLALTFGLKFWTSIGFWDAHTMNDINILTEVEKASKDY